MDGLSRLPLTHVQPIGHSPDPAVFNLRQLNSLPVTANKLSSATRTDVLSQVYRYITKGWPHDVDASLTSFESKKAELTVEGGCGVSVWWYLRNGKKTTIYLNSIEITPVFKSDLGALKHW